MVAQNGTAIGLRKQQRHAAALLAAGDLTDGQIAQELEIGRRTLVRWKQQPAFLVAVQAERDAIVAALRAQSIVVKQNRIDALNRRHQELCRIIDERAADPAMAAIPGGTTGLLVKQLKSIGFGEHNQLVTEFVLDVGLLRELRAHEQQAAQELGQWIAKSEEKHDLSEQFVAALREFCRGTEPMTTEQWRAGR